MIKWEGLPADRSSLYMCNVCRPVKQINSHTQSRPKLTGITSPRTLFSLLRQHSVLLHWRWVLKRIYLDITAVSCIPLLFILIRFALELKFNFLPFFLFSSNFCTFDPLPSQCFPSIPFPSLPFSFLLFSSLHLYYLIFTFLASVCWPFRLQKCPFSDFLVLWNRTQRPVSASRL